MMTAAERGLILLLSCDDLAMIHRQFRRTTHYRLETAKSKPSAPSS